MRASPRGWPAGPTLTRSDEAAEFLDLVRMAGLRVPRGSAKVGPFEVDFSWQPEGIAVDIEVDGSRRHASRSGFEREHRNDAWLQDQGIQVIAVTWRQIQHKPAATAVYVAQALVRVAAVGLPGVRAHGMLHSHTQCVHP